MITEEDGGTGNRTRLRYLTQIVDGPSAPLRLCERELEVLRAKFNDASNYIGIREIMHRLSWPLKREESHKAINTIRNIIHAVDMTLALDTNRTVRQLEDRLKQTQVSAEQTHEMIESIKAHQHQEGNAREGEQDEDLGEEIFEWLAHPDPSELHREISRARNNDVANTGRWFLDGEDFETFENSPRSFIWLHGQSGCGKSTLCSMILDDLVATARENHQMRVAYWYFTETESRRMNLETLIRSLLTQIVPVNSVPASLIDLWKNTKSRERPKVQDLIDTFKQILVEQDLSTYFVVLDALDENGQAERDDILDFVKDIASLGNAGIHVLITRRSLIVNLDKTQISIRDCSDIAITTEHANKDILAHILERLENDNVLRMWPANERKGIEKTLMERAAENFQWVNFQLQDIRKYRKPSELQRTLLSLPQDMHKTYTRVLARLDENRSEDARKLLDWLAYPQRPLRIEETVEMLAIDVECNPPQFKKEDRILITKGFFNAFGNLIRVGYDTDGVDSLGRTAEVLTISASHSSVIDFIRTQPISIGSRLETRVSGSAANARMAEKCITYLLYLIEEDIVLTASTMDNYPFARLSAELWATFYKGAEPLADPGVIAHLDSLAIKLFANPESMLKWIRLHVPDQWPPRAQFDFTPSAVRSALHCASFFGLPRIVKHFLDANHKINDLLPEGTPFIAGTPLIAAIAHGHTEIVAFLLNNGPYTEIKGRSRMSHTPLGAVIDMNNMDIVKQLLRYGVNLARFRICQVPPNYIGSLDTSGIIDEGHDVTMKYYVIFETQQYDDFQIGRAIIAAEHVPVGVLELLLEAGVGLYSTDGEDCDGTALKAACKEGKVGSVHFMWDFPEDEENDDDRLGVASQPA